MPLLKVVSLTSPALAFTNYVYLNNPNCKNKYYKIQNYVYRADHTDKQAVDTIALNSIQRKDCKVEVDGTYPVEEFLVSQDYLGSKVTIGVDFIVKKAEARLEVKNDDILNAFFDKFDNHVFRMYQKIAFDYNGQKLELVVQDFENTDIKTNAVSKKEFVYVSRNISEVTFEKALGCISSISIQGAALKARNDNLFKGDFDFASLGIGGLDNQFMKMFRVAFSSRLFPGVVRELGTSHVRGILLYGPPGCGKTLIARQIGRILNAREPKIVNGPEVLDKYVGGSEEKIRQLFVDAEREQKEQGDNSMLHIIIFDEMDAIMKQRGSNRSDSGVGDSVVNQLLSKIDGVDSLNNILIIGMTNRKDLIDEAILRPGRLEIHIEIALPDKKGRKQILDIKTATMKKSNRITQEALDKLDILAEETKNFTGAELEGLVRNAASFALARNINPKEIKEVDTNAIKVEWEDFLKAFNETTPAFGNKNSDELKQYYSNGIFDYGKKFEALNATLEKHLTLIKESSRTRLLSVLMDGEPGSGKTAIAAKLAHDSGYNFIRIISPNSLVGMNELQKCSYIQKVFTEAYNSPISLIFIDDIERIIEFSRVGPRFSNNILQTILIFLKNLPPNNNKLLVLCTSNMSEILRQLDLYDVFHFVNSIPLLTSKSEYEKVILGYCNNAGIKINPNVLDNITSIIPSSISVKKLLMIVDRTFTNCNGNFANLSDEFFESINNMNS